MRLYHYTCGHRYPSIMRDGLLRCNPQIQLPGAPAIVWFTDLHPPDRLALGLTSYSLSCDRIEHCITVDFSDDAPPWQWYAWARRNLSLDDRWLLEGIDGTRPAHWWLSTDDVPLQLTKAG